MEELNQYENKWQAMVQVFAKDLDIKKNIFKNNFSLESFEKLNEFGHIFYNDYIETDQYKKLQNTEPIFVNDFHNIKGLIDIQTEYITKYLIYLSKDIYKTEVENTKKKFDPQLNDTANTLYKEVRSDLDEKKDKNERSLLSDLHDNIKILGRYHNSTKPNHTIDIKKNNCIYEWYFDDDKTLHKKNLLSLSIGKRCFYIKNVQRIYRDELKNLFERTIKLISINENKI